MEMRFKNLPIIKARTFFTALIKLSAAQPATNAVRLLSYIGRVRRSNKIFTEAERERPPKTHPSPILPTTRIITHHPLQVPQHSRDRRKTNHVNVDDIPGTSMSLLSPNTISTLSMIMLLCRHETRTIYFYSTQEMQEHRVLLWSIAYLAELLLSFSTFVVRTVVKGGNNVSYSPVHAPTDETPPRGQNSASSQMLSIS